MADAAPRLGWRRMLLNAVGILAATYALICVAMFVMQDRLMFPADATPTDGPLPRGAERLDIARPDGLHLRGVHIPARGGEGDLLIVFPGNAMNAQALAEDVSAILPDMHVVAFAYRGYAPSDGSPSAGALIEDAAIIHDWVAARYRPRRILLYGQSIGSGVAAALASERATAGVILVTPFDSLRAVVASTYSWLPVGLLFRHEMASAQRLAGRQVPSAIIAGSADTLIRPERTDGLRAALADLRFDRVIQGAGHNDVSSDPLLAPALREAVAALTQR